MSYQPEAIPDDLPPHPSEAGAVDGKLTIEEWVDGDGVDPTVTMRWSGHATEYARALSPPPGLPPRFEDSPDRQVKDTPLSECTPEEIVALTGWYMWHESDARDLFEPNDPTDRRDDPPTAEEFVRTYRIAHRFDTDHDRVHLQALGMTIYSREDGGVDWTGFDLIDGDEREAAVYYPPNPDDAAVLLFDDGRGYYCCRREADVETVDEWFRAAFDRWTDEGLVPVQFDDPE